MISTDWFSAFLLSTSLTHVLTSHSLNFTHCLILLQPTFLPVLSNPFTPPPLTPSTLSLYIFIPLTTLSLSSSHPNFSPFHSTFSTNVLITLSHNTLASGISHYRLSHSSDLLPLSLAQLAPLYSSNSLLTLTSSYSLHSTHSSQLHTP